jgi:hypothetical protein
VPVAVFSPDLFPGLVDSPFFTAVLLPAVFSFVGVAVACDFFFSGVALGFGEAFFRGLDFGEDLGDGFGAALGDGVGCGVAAGICISLFAADGAGCFSSGGDGVRSGSGGGVSSIWAVSAVGLPSAPVFSHVISCALAGFEAPTQRNNAIKAATWTSAIKVTFRQKRALDRILILIPLWSRCRPS